MSFVDRPDAGRQLATALTKLAFTNPVVIALPRGGVPVAAEVAGRLRAPLDVTVIRKLGYPGQPELGMGAIAENGVRLLNTALIARLDITPPQIDAVVAAEQTELERRVQRYRAGRPPTPVAGRTVIVVDDGIATGFTARAAILALRQQGALRIVLAVPVGPPRTIEALRDVADEVVCLQTPEWFMAIGQFYADFPQTTDDEVTALLAEHVEHAHTDNHGRAVPPSATTP